MSEKYWSRMNREELEGELQRVNDEILQAQNTKDYENWDDLMWSRTELLTLLSTMDGE